MPGQRDVDLSSEIGPIRFQRKWTKHEENKEIEC